MARPLRIEFPGALYHVTSRGDRREPIFDDDEDREMFLAVLGEVVDRFNWRCHAYCLMGNHYHLVVETVEGNLSKGMRQLNGVFTQASNRRHGRSGHLLQGRFKAILVDREAYLLELARYVVLNPVRAGMVGAAGDWPWSSYGATAGVTGAPGYLTTEALLSMFARRKRLAHERYVRFVAEGVGQPSPWRDLRQQIYLGGEEFIRRMQAQAGDDMDALAVPKLQRRAPAASLAEIEALHAGRDPAIVAAHGTGAYSYREIAAHFGLHPGSVGKIVRRATGRK
jgi:putative transposase